MAQHHAKKTRAGPTRNVVYVPSAPPSTVSTPVFHSLTPCVFQKELATARRHEEAEFIANLQEQQGPLTARRVYNFRGCAPRGVVRRMNDSGVHKQLRSLPMITGFIQTQMQPTPPSCASNRVPALNLADTATDCSAVSSRVPDPLVGVFRPKPGAACPVRPLYTERGKRAKALHWKGAKTGDVQAFALNDDSMFSR